jgi:hypothetical protein
MFLASARGSYVREWTARSTDGQFELAEGLVGPSRRTDVDLQGELV